MKKIVAKTVKLVSAALTAAAFLPVSSFAQPAAGRVYRALDSGAYIGPQVTYDFGFFASLIVIAALGALLYILKGKTSEKKQ